jgi:hypothetical protein
MFPDTPSLRPVSYTIHLPHFSLAKSPRANGPASQSQRLNLMSSAEIDLILMEAEKCAEGECALDEVSSLIENLQNQQSMLSKRVNEIDGLIKTLETANGRGGDRPVDEMKETVKAIFRIFALGVS